MSLEDKAYAVYWALSGLTRPRTTATFLRDRRRIAQAERQAPLPAPLDGLGSVERLTILPLVDFYPARPDLVGESGVSYLIEAGGRTVLFDVGCNELDEEPSPLVRNMQALGISVSDFDAIFISHCHLDHVGGPRWARERTFSLSREQVELPGITAYTPIPMTHPTARTEYVARPRVLGEGLASTGPMERAIWLSGPVAEQALLVNVRDKGPVMIVGCGHPQLERLVERAQALTGGAALHGIVGGLHFPVTGSRVGKGRQNIIGNGKLPWQRITRQEAARAAEMLRSMDLALVALSAHDSCDWTLEVFRQALGERYRPVRVGEGITIG